MNDGGLVNSLGGMSAGETSGALSLCAVTLLQRRLQPRHLRSGRAGRQRRKADPDQFDRDHAGDHHPDDDRDGRRRLVVPARQQEGEYRPDWEYSGAIEMVVWAIPALTIMLLGGIAWIGSHDLEPSKPLNRRTPPLKVDVVSLDWKWLFIYPDQGIATVNQLVVPAGTPVTFRLTSATVWNSFFVPQMGIDDLHHAAHDDAPEPAGGPARRLSTGCRRISAATAFPGMQFKVHVGSAATSSRPGRRARAAGPGARRPRLRRAVEAEQLCEADDLRQRSRPACSTPSSPAPSRPTRCLRRRITAAVSGSEA